MKAKLPGSYASWLSTRLDLSGLVNALDRARLERKVAVHCAVLLARRNLSDRLKAKHLPFGTLQQLESSKHGTLHLLTVNDEHGEPEFETPIRFHPVPDTPLVLALSIGRQTEWMRGTNRVLDWLWPSVYRPFLRQPELRSIFSAMQGALRGEYEIRLTGVSASRRLLRGRSRRKFATELAWTDLEFGDAFEEAARSLSYFKRLAFEVCEQQDEGRLRGIGLEGVVTHDAHFASTTHFGWLMRTAVQNAIGPALRDHKFAQNRSRTPDSGPRPAVMVAAFDENVAVEQIALAKLGAVLRSMPHVVVSVLHDNPFFHASLVDMRDGSSFDVVLASDRRLLIVPQLRATEAAVSRLCRFIYEQVGEASFQDVGGAS